MPLQRNGVNLNATGLADMRSDLGIARDVPGIGEPLTIFRYTGSDVDVALPADGTPADLTASFSSVPADAVGIEVMLSNTGGTDYLFSALTAGRLNTAGADLAARTAANLLACRWVANGDKMVLPFVTKGVIPTTWRWASGSSSASRLQARYISDASLRMPYLMASTTEVVLTGAAASQIPPHTDTNRFPAGWSAFQFQVLGGAARMRFDGGVPTATFGHVLQPGRQYYLDPTRHGISIAALRLFLPVGVNVVGHSLKPVA